MTLTQVGKNVVATGSGNIELTGLTFFQHGTGEIGIGPSFPQIAIGSPTSTANDVYTGATGPARFGSGGFTLADSGSGAFVDVQKADVSVPAGYSSGSSLGASTATWDNATFASLGVTPGTYVWTWKSSAAADDNFTIDAVPEPGSLALLGTALVGWSRRRRRG